MSALSCLTTPAELLKKDGIPYGLSVNGRSIHSEREPEREAIRFAQYIGSQYNPRTLSIIIGIGWGIHIPPILNLLKSENLTLPVFFEPLQSVSLLLQRASRLKELELTGATITTGIEELKSFLQKRAVTTIDIYIHPFYRRNFPELPEELISILDLHSKAPEKNPSEEVDIFTQKRFTRTWFRNHFRLLQSQKHLTFLSKSNRESKTDAIIYAGAGPTLWSDLARLPENSNGYYLVSSDTALAPLLAKGIRPHMVISVDSGPGTLYHMIQALNVDKNFMYDVDLITWSGGHPVLPELFRHTYYYGSTLPLDQIQYDDAMKNVAMWTNPARNPSGLAILLAGQYNISRVFLAGSGFRSIGRVTHIPGTGYENYARMISHITSPYDTYRAGGYSNSANHKSRVALNGLNELTNESGCQLFQLFNTDDTITHQHDLKIHLSEEPFPFSKTVIPTVKMRERLLHQLSIPAVMSELQNSIDPDCLIKWSKMFED